MGNEFGNAFATMQQTLQRGRESTRKEKAYNAFRAAYGDTAGDPDTGIKLQELDQAKINAPLQTEHLQLSNAATQQGIDLSNTREAENKRKTNAGGLLSGALYIQNARKRDPNADVGQLFDRIAPVLELDPAATAQVRQSLVQDPGAADDLVNAFRLKQAAEKGDPAAVQEYQYYSRLDPQGQADYLKVKRAPFNAVRDVNGVPTAIQVAPGATQPQQTPLTTLQGQVAGTQAVAGGKAAGTAVGKATGETAAEDLAPSNAGKNKIQTAIEQNEQSFDVATKAIDTALSDTGWLSAGPIASMTSFVNPYAANLKNELVTVQSKIVLDTIAEMKAASKTGATGLGALSDREGELIQARLGAVLQSTTPARLKKSLRDLQTQMEASRSRVRRSLEASLKRGQPAAAADESHVEGNNVILKWNAEKGDFE